MLPIDKMLTISTAHVSQETAKLLDQEPEDNRMALTVYEKGAPGESFGWFIYLDPHYQGSGFSEQLAAHGRIPEDLAGCLRLANDAGCGILCLDQDGAVLPYLKTYEWDG